MSLESKCKKFFKYILKYLKYEVKNPVYVPIIKRDFLKDRIIFITGGSGGIGYSFARTFIDNGAKMIITGRSISRLGKVKEKLIAETRCRLECILPIVLDMNEFDKFSNIIQQVDNILDNKNLLI